MELALHTDGPTQKKAKNVCCCLEVRHQWQPWPHLLFATRTLVVCNTHSVNLFICCIWDTAFGKSENTEKPSPQEQQTNLELALTFHQLQVDAGSNLTFRGYNTHFGYRKGLSSSLSLSCTVAALLFWSMFAQNIRT